MPADVLEQAKAAFGRRHLGEHAALVFDSLIDAGDSPSDHTLRFEHPAIRIDLRAMTTSEGCSFRGELTPPTPHRVELLRDGAEVGIMAAADEGNFGFAGVPPGLMRLILTRPDRTRIATDWFRV